MHGEKGYCKVCLAWDYVAETQAVDLAGVHLGLRWTPSLASEIEARMRLAGLLPAAGTPQPAPTFAQTAPAAPQRLDRDTLERLAIAELLIIDPNANRIAKRIGVPRSTLQGWPTFQEYYDRMKKDAEARRQERRGQRAGERDFEADEED
jgi:hypothetical protein